MSGMRQTGPLKQAVSARMRATAQHLDKTHPETTAAGHVRDAATMLTTGRTDSAKRHLDAAMEVLTPRNLIRHGITDDAGHTTAKQAMHTVNRLRLQVMDIEDIHTANQAEAERRRSAAAEERETKARAQAIRTGAFPQPTQADANGTHPAQSPTGKPGPDGKTPVPGNLSQYRKQRPPTAGELAESQLALSNIDLAFDPAQPRDMRGRWAHTPSYRGSRARQLGAPERQRQSALWGGRTFDEHEAAVGRLTPKQRVVYLHLNARGTSPADALYRAQQVDQPRKSGPPQSRRAIYGGRTLDQYLRAKSRLTPAQNAEFVRASGMMSPGAALARARTIQTANTRGAIELVGPHGWSHGWVFHGQAGSPEHAAFIRQRVVTSTLGNPTGKIGSNDDQWGPHFARQAADQIDQKKWADAARSLDKAASAAGRLGRLDDAVGLRYNAHQLRKRAKANAPAVPGSMGLGELIPGRTGTLLSNQIELSARTAMLERTPAPRGKPGGPGLYDVKGMGHTDYLQQIVKALIEKRGMPPGKAYAIARGAIRKWMRGGGHVHPEVMAAAGRAEAGEVARQARAHAHTADSWETADRLIELAAGGPQWQSQTRVPPGQAGGGQFGANKGSAAAGKQGGHGNRAKRRAALVRKAVSIRLQIRQLEAQLASLHHHGKSKSSKPAKKGAAAISAKAAKAGKTATGKAKAATKATAHHHTMSAATIHAKINALRAELAAVLRQIHHLSNDGDAIELAWSTAWMHELRNHGRWTTDGGMAAKMIKPVKPPKAPRLGSLRAKAGREEYKIHSRDEYPATLAAAERPLARLAGPHPLQADPIPGVDRHGKPLTAAAQKLAADRQAGTAPTPITQEDLQKAIYQAASEMRTAEFKLRAEEDKKRRQKLAVHTAAIVGGAALTYAETKIPGITGMTREALTTTTAPGALMAQELIDWARRL